MKIKVRTTTTLTVLGLIMALEKGTFKGKKIKKLEWLYEYEMTDAGRGNPTYEQVVSGAEIEFV